MKNVTTIKCANCGADLNAEINREYIFCTYCGGKNRIESEEMKTNIKIGNISISAKTEVDNLISSAEYAINIKQFDKANEMLIASIMSGCEDYRVYICKAMIDLHTDDGKSLFTSLEKLKSIEMKQNNNEVTQAICTLMSYRGINGVTALHNSTFHERFDMVVFCVEHGGDVNLIAGMNRVSPISIMFVPIAKTLSKIDGTPFIRNKEIVKQIRQYLMQHGAKDKWRMGY
ncbi:MAG: hypothetical protein FWF92_07930 [Oscillospiraceae bacterium]|nr:hypothetical protein [Oscillospiraceae bacterium]